MNNPQNTPPKWALRLWQWAQDHEVPEQRIPKEMTQLLALESLTLGYLKLESVPAEIGQLKQLKSLSLRGNVLTHLPKEIILLQQLTSLDLGNNWFEQLPKVVGQLSALKQLDISENDALETLPNAITRLKQLEVLVANNCYLSTLPQGIAHWQNLYLLNLSGNPIQQLPQEIIELKRLYCLFCANTMYNFDYFRYPLLELCPNLALFSFSSSQDITSDVSYLHDKIQTSQLSDFIDFDDMGVLYPYCMLDEKRAKKGAQQKTWSKKTNKIISSHINSLQRHQVNWLIGDYDHLSPLTLFNQNPFMTEDELEWEFIKENYP